MSSQLSKQASYEATFAHNFRKQTLSRVPVIPSSTSLPGRTVIVAGANAGIGFEAVRNFLKLRPKLIIMAVRSLKKGEVAAATLRSEFPDDQIEVWELDMESFRSVQDFAARTERELDRFDVAVLNAGLAKLEFQRVEGGSMHEVTIQVNYLATALLSILLLSKLKPTNTSPEPGRLSIVNSGASLGLSLEDPGDE